MADTERTITQLTDNLFPDGQAAGSITAQDIRDLVVSLQPAFGGIYIDTPAATKISVAGTMVKGAGTTTTTVLSNFSHTVDNILAYTGPVARRISVTATGTVTTAGTADNISVGIAFNGTVNDPSKVTIHMPVGTEALPFACHADAELTVGSQISVYVTNEDTTATVTLGQMKLFTIGMLV